MKDKKIKKKVFFLVNKVLWEEEKNYKKRVLVKTIFGNIFFFVNNSFLMKIFAVKKVWSLLSQLALLSLLSLLSLSSLLSLILLLSNR